MISLNMCRVFFWFMPIVVCLLPEKIEAKLSDLQLLDSLLEKYDRRATPTNHLNCATRVTCEFYIRSFGSIDPSSMDYQVDLYLRQSWKDTRLSHPDFRQPLDLNDPKLVQAIWKPEVYFPNAKKAEFQFVTVPNVLVRIEGEGRILYMLRLKLTFACMMEMSKFPLDSQICTMEVASFSKTVKELTLAWKQTSAIKMYKNLRMPQFQIENIAIGSCKEPIQIGNYSCLVAEFHLRRSIGFHLVQSYLPTFLIVAISWVSFWMDVDSVPARTTLGVTTLLAVSTKSGIQEGLPQVSYVKAIDVWMGACTAFVFTSLLEFTLVNYLWRRNPKSKYKQCVNGFGLRSRSDKTLNINPPRSASMVVAGPDGIGVVVAKGIACKNIDNQTKCRRVSSVDQDNVDNQEKKYYNRSTATDNTMQWPPWVQKSKLLAQSIDELCRVLFPMMFAIFNICYWTYYMYL